MTTFSKSYLQRIYNSVSAIESLEPEIRISDLLLPDQLRNVSVKNPFVSLKEVQEKIINSVDYCRTRTKCFEIDTAIDNKCAEDIYAALYKLPEVKDDSCCIKLIEARTFNEVTLISTLPPTFKLKVPSCENNTVQILNTGYIISIPTSIEKREVADGMATASDQATSQKDFVIIPKIYSANENIVPSIHARDADDTGPFTVSIYNRYGEDCELIVYLYAYGVPSDTISMLRTNFRFENPDGSDVSIIKPIDILTPERKLYNFLAKVKFADGEEIGDNTSIRLPCFDGNRGGDDRAARPRKNIVIDDACVFFESRKREWCNPKLFTVSGVFLPKGSWVKPRVYQAENSKHRVNTHCFVVLESRLTLYCVESRNSPTVKLEPRYLAMNGTMFDIPNYKVIKKALTALLCVVYNMREVTYNNKLNNKRHGVAGDCRDDLISMGNYDADLVPAGMSFDDFKLFESYISVQNKRNIYLWTSSIYYNLRVLILQFFTPSELIEHCKNKLKVKCPSTDHNTDGSIKIRKLI